jgi:NADPH-dependent 2,4-dienoyl-CoA reductase/sulfur reductase-like enzyme
MAGIPVDDGVLVDKHPATSVPDIFAADDIARWPDRYSGGRIRVEHWVMAERSQLMGHCQSYIAVPLFWTEHFDLSASRDGLVRFENGFWRSRRGARHGCLDEEARLRNRRRPAQRRLAIDGDALASPIRGATPMPTTTISASSRVPSSSREAPSFTWSTFRPTFRSTPWSR